MAGVNISEPSFIARVTCIRHYSCCYLNVANHYNNVTTHALIGTGASVSAMSEYFFSRLFKDVVKNKLDTHDEKLHSICGQSLEITEIYELLISLDANVHSLNQQFYIIPKLTETCILGMDFITRNSVILNGKTRKLSYMIDNKTFTVNDEIKKLR